MLVRLVVPVRGRAEGLQGLAGWWMSVQEGSQVEMRGPTAWTEPGSGRWLEFISLSKLESWAIHGVVPIEELAVNVGKDEGPWSELPLSCPEPFLARLR